MSGRRLVRFTHFIKSTACGRQRAAVDLLVARGSRGQGARRADDDEVRNELDGREEEPLGLLCRPHEAAEIADRLQYVPEEGELLSVVVHDQQQLAPGDLLRTEGGDRQPVGARQVESLK